MTTLRTVRAEIRKLTSTKMSISVLAVLVAIGAGTATAVAFGTDMDGSKTFISTAADQQSLMAFAANALVIAGLFGAMAVAREYGHGTVVLTFLTTPRRPRAVLAQFAAVFVAGSILGLAGAGVSAGSVAVGLTATDYGFMVSAADLAQVLAASTLAGGAGAVLGAGIMGGGIAYQSALKGTPIIMKDIAQAGIDLGLDEAGKLLSKQVERGRMSVAEMAGVLNKIQPSLSYEGFDSVDVVVEAVVENPKVKHSVLAETETQIRDDAILASNTSTISITHLAEPLKRPENFCGMHFFNPVHRMPLVEVIRGEKTGEDAIARTVAYALAMGKKPIVVNDCPGFLVNRILSPYIGAFMGLVRRGVDFVAIDRAMERFGWPMGPAYLCDVVGIDTGVHAGAVMAEGFPDRMKYDFKTCHEVMYENERFGQKNGCGYYAYEADRKGRPKKIVDKDAIDFRVIHLVVVTSFFGRVHHFRFKNSLQAQCSSSTSGIAASPLNWRQKCQPSNMAAVKRYPLPYCTGVSRDDASRFHGKNMGLPGNGEWMMPKKLHTAAIPK